MPQTPLQGSVNKAGIAVVVENAATFNLQGQNPQYPAAPGLGFSFGLTLSPGDNPVRLSAVDQAGSVATRVHNLIYVPGPPQLTIQSPANGALINDDSVTVAGAWNGQPNTGITVNGVIAAVSGNAFSASVPLTAGANTIAVVGTSPDRSTSTVTVQVTSSGPPAVRVTASPASGFAPINVTFNITSDKPVSTVNGNYAVGVQQCFEEGGIFCYDVGNFAQSPTDLFQFLYSQPGIYEARFNILFQDGTTAVKSLRIAVLDQNQLDAQLRQVWSAMLGQLRSGNINGALNNLMPDAVERFKLVFENFGPDLPAFIDGIGQIVDGAISADFAEYVIARPDAGGMRGFRIYLMRASDGVWRISEM